MCMDVYVCKRAGRKKERKVRNAQASVVGDRRSFPKLSNKREKRVRVLA